VPAAPVCDRNGVDMTEDDGSDRRALEDSFKVPTVTPEQVSIVNQAIVAKKALPANIIELAERARSAQRSAEGVLAGVRAAMQAHTFVDTDMMKRIQAATTIRPFLPPGLVSLVADIDPSSKAIAANLGAIAASYQASLQAMQAPFQQVFAKIAENRRRSKLVEDTGWLPHATTPFDRIDVDGQDASVVAALIARHYADRWDDVAATFRDSLARYDIDAEAKATFDEALRAHSAGLYRTVPRLLFPEIERVASVEFYEGKHEIPRENGKGKVGITSLPGIRREASNLPAGDVLAYDFGMDLFQKLEAHLYEKVGEEPERIAEIAADPLPNRHAALHGIVSYTSAQNSINMLIMTDFMFHLISQMKKCLEDEIEVVTTDI
jgi:hypothetical protein